MTGTIRTLYPTHLATERGNFGTRPPLQAGKTATLTGEAAIFATLRPPTGKPVEQRLRDLATFWSADSAPHLLARAALVAIEAERQQTRQALAEVKRLRRRLAAIPTIAADDSLAAELEDA